MSISKIRDWYRARPGYWFRPKLFGWGATPVTWQGWALTAAVVALAYAIARFATAEHQPVLLGLLVPLIACFAWVCWRKTDGEWRWRAGGD